MESPKVQKVSHWLSKLEKVPKLSSLNRGLVVMNPMGSNPSIWDPWDWPDETIAIKLSSKTNSCIRQWKPPFGVTLAEVAIIFPNISQMLHVGNIYLHFPLNVAIFHLM